MSPIKLLTLAYFVTAAVAGHAALTSDIRASGKTLATSQLATDVLNRIVGYTSANNGCHALDGVRMKVLSRDCVPMQPAGPAKSHGGHFERWSIDACGGRQQFQVGLWPSPKGGSDFSVTPLTGRIPLQSGIGAPQALPLSAWHGRYVWQESLGRIGGSSPSEGAAAFVTYTLSLGLEKGAAGCTLNAEGFQNNTRMLCTATPSGPSVIIKFYGYGSDNVGGQHTIGERLLALTRDSSGIVTQLEGLAPASDSTARKGRLFRRAA